MEGVSQKKGLTQNTCVVLMFTLILLLFGKTMIFDPRMVQNGPPKWVQKQPRSGDNPADADQGEKNNYDWIPRASFKSLNISFMFLFRPKIAPNKPQNARFGPEKRTAKV